MEKFKAFCKRKNIEVSAKRYGIDALGAMAQGLFCSLLIGTIIKTLGAQLGVPFLTDIGTYAMSVSGPAMAVAIGYALKADPMVLFSLAAVGYAANAEGGAGGPLAVLIIAILAAECGKAVSKETKIDILVTPAVTILVGVALAKWIAPPIGTAASAFASNVNVSEAKRFGSSSMPLPAMIPRISSRVRCSCWWGSDTSANQPPIRFTCRRVRRTVPASSGSTAASSLSVSASPSSVMRSSPARNISPDKPECDRMVRMRPPRALPRPSPWAVSCVWPCS